MQFAPLKVCELVRIRTKQRRDFDTLCSGQQAQQLEDLTALTKEQERKFGAQRREVEHQRHKLIHLREHPEE